MIGVGFKTFARTPVPKLPQSYPSPQPRVGILENFQTHMNHVNRGSMMYTHMYTCTYLA